MRLTSMHAVSTPTRCNLVRPEGEAGRVEARGSKSRCSAGARRSQPSRSGLRRLCVSLSVMVIVALVGEPSVVPVALLKLTVSVSLPSA